MAPAEHVQAAPSSILHLIPRSTSTSAHSPSSISPLSTIFAAFSSHAVAVITRTISHTVFASTSRSDLAATPFKTHQRSQRNANPIVVIPLTYAGLNKGPAPGVVAGIMLGSIAAFGFILWLIWLLLRLGGYFGTTTIVEQEIIRERRRSHSRSRSRTETMSEVRSPPRRQRTRREEAIVVEERVSVNRPPPEDDIVEVIEEHSPERRPNRRESKRMSGFRTVDPDAPGGGDAPMRRVSKR